MNDLVVLLYADNIYYTTVRSAEPHLPEGLTIDLDTCSWKFDGREYHIGHMRHCEYGCRWGVIGVYDRTKIEHLNNMLHHSREATKQRTSFYDAEYA
jgi:hypothetical protein